MKIFTNGYTQFENLESLYGKNNWKWFFTSLNFQLTEKKKLNKIVLIHPNMRMLEIEIAVMIRFQLLLRKQN